MDPMDDHQHQQFAQYVTGNEPTGTSCYKYRKSPILANGYVNSGVQPNHQPKHDSENGVLSLPRALKLANSEGAISTTT